MDDAVTSASRTGRGRATRAAALAAAVVLAGAGLWAYLPILDNGFVWDDGANLMTARAYWGHGVDGIVWAFTRPYYGHYQPLTWMSYRLDVLISGGTPRGVHATNLVLHAIATALVAMLAWTLSRAREGQQERPGTDAFAVRATASLLCAAVFALHPIHVETVAWATERRDLLSTILVLAAVLLHLRSRPADASPSRTRGVVAALHALAALARAQISLPFVLLALDMWPLNRLAASAGTQRPLLRLIAEKRLSFLVAAASAAAAIWAQASSGALTSFSESGVVDRCVQAGYNLAFHAAALVYRPYWLPLYERPYPFEPLAWRYLGPAVAAVAVVAGLAAAWAWRRRPSALAIAVGCYVLLVLPVSGLAQSGIQLVAERYAYLATIPLILIGGVAIARVVTGLDGAAARAVAWVTILGMLTVAAVTTRRQTQVWRSDETLWRHVLAHAGSALADNNLGQILAARGETGIALHHLVRAVERAPTYPRPWRAIAAILEAPWPPAAPPARYVATTIERAAAMQPRSALHAYASALAWLRTGERTRAEEGFRRVLAIEPGHDGARVALAALQRTPRPAAATTGPAPPGRP